MTAPTRTTRRAGRVGAAWHNWSGAQAARPAEVARPATEAEVVETVTRAAEAGLHVKTVGAGHSFSGVAVTDGVLISLDELSGVVNVDREAMEVTFLAGTRLRDVPRLLRPHGLALANQGDVDPQSLAGAIATSTHGTGLGFTGLAGMVRGQRIVTSDGTVHDVGPGDELFELGRVHLGALGVVTRVTVAVVETFVLAAVERAEPVAALRDDFARAAASADHVEYYWFPGTDVAHVKRNTRHRLAERDRVAAPIPRWRAVLEDELANNVAYRAMCALGHFAPSTTPTLNRLSARFLAQREYSDLAHDVFVSARRVRFNEMEYAVPLADAAEVLGEVHRRLDSRDVQVTFPIEVRATGADEVPLSTGYGRESCYIAVHRYHRDDHEELFELIEPVLVAAGGRPHWGKLHTLDHDGLAAVHPHLDAVGELRARVDPQGVFRNPMVDRIFGLD
ncbi:D-arabinono-1,4-lactone oxidase [Corynebacterium frankenforstense]